MVDAADELARVGAVRLRGLAKNTLADWIEATEAFFAPGKPGHRISGSAPVARLAAEACRLPGFTQAAGAGWRCVRAIAFNKSREANWGLGWHQDRTIAVARREAVSGFEVWSQKDGIPHVEPPFALLERMVTLRVHLDPVGEDNAPLLVAMGSHLRGRLPESEVTRVADQTAVMACHAEPGDCWLYATAILHASSRSASEAARRVIQLDFSRDPLPSPLEWAGIG